MSRIQLKLMAALAILVFVVVGTTGAIAERALRAREMHSIELHVEERARLVRALLRGHPLEWEARETLDALADSAGAAAAARVTLVDSGGRVVGDSSVALSRLGTLEDHSARPEVIDALRQGRGRATRQSETTGLRYLYLAIPVEKPDAPGSSPGVLRLAVPLDAVDAAAADLRRVLLIASALGLAGALLLSFGVAWVTLRPVEELRDGVNAIAAGELDRPVIRRARDEIGEIADSINQVASQLRARLDAATAETERLETVLSSMVEGVLVLEDGRITLANPRLQELFSAWGPLEGRRPIEVIRNDELHRALQQAAESDEPVVAELTLDGAEERVVLVHAVKFSPSKDHSGVVAVTHDVSEIRRLEQVRRDFIANASHELRTPLTSIRGFADTMQGASLSPEEQRSYLEVIGRNADRLGALIEDLLELSRIESRKFPLQLSAIDALQLCNTLVADLGPRLVDAGVTAAVVDEGAVPALADRRAVEQVVTNLIDNALKYSDAGGEIRIVVGSDKAMVRVTIEDKGIGIPAADRSRIFERFYRVDKARSRALGGTGLGLSIVKHLVQSMGGEVGVESEAGRGSAFRFSLPRADGARGDGTSSNGV